MNQPKKVATGVLAITLSGLLVLAVMGLMLKLAIVSQVEINTSEQRTFDAAIIANQEAIRVDQQQQLADHQKVLASLGRLEERMRAIESQRGK